MFLSNPPNPPGPPPSNPSLYRSFGAWLKGARTSTTLSQKQLVENISLPFFRARHVAVLNWRMYSSMERDERIPLFEELEPIYRTFTEGCGLTFSELDRDLYIKLARERIDAKQKKAQHIKPVQWDQLMGSLAGGEGRKRDRIYLLDRHEPTSSSHEEGKDSRRLKALAEALHTDTSHLLEREEWVQQMLTYASMTLPKKVVTIQGHQGTGKSHALALLTQRFVQHSDAYLLPYRFESGEGKTPEDHLSVFLATILADLMQVTVLDDATQTPYEERINQVIAAIQQRNEQGQKVIFFLDDAQEIFPSAITWSPAWQEIFQRFVREPHASTIYLATRIWPEWIDRRRTYLEETNLPELSPEAGVVMWQRFGFTDVPEELIHQVVAKWGSNPHLIEMRASHLRQRPWAFAWDRSGLVKDRLTSEAESENTTRLKKLLEQDALFNAKTDIEAQSILQHVISSRLSHPALRMLECLALSPLGLPFSLLEEDFPRAYVAFDELTRASLTDLRMASANRAAVAPLAREAQIQSLINDGRYPAVESRVTDLYAHWLHDVQDFRDDAEKSALIAEMIIRDIRARQLLKAAELFINFGWLCALFGHIARIRRVFDDAIKADRGKEEDVQHEVGRLLLQNHIALKTGQKISKLERGNIYQQIHEYVLIGEIELQSYSEIDVLHQMILLYLSNLQFLEARQILDTTLARLCQNGPLAPEINASYLSNKGRLLSRLWEKAERNQDSTELQRLKQECIMTLKETIFFWKKSLKNALPLQEHYTKFKMARTLNDYAYRQRLCGNLGDAQKAIEESLNLKKESGALPHSIAISLSEYSQVLAAQGNIRQALLSNEEAINLLEHLAKDDNTVHNPELGVCLMERANILEMQARLDDAQLYLERAIPLIGNKSSRQNFVLHAKNKIDEIRFFKETGQQFWLDRQWFSRYQNLASFNYLAWLAYTGPFNEEEQREWNQLFLRRNEEEQSTRMNTLVLQSRRREFVMSQDEQRNPRLCYPLIELEDVQNRRNKFLQLQKEIESKETHPIIRSLYMDAINEQILILRQCEATALSDQNTVWESNLSLYGKPTTREFYIALQSLCEMAFTAQNDETTRLIAQEVLNQLDAWGLSPYDIVAMKFYPTTQGQELVPSFKQKFSDNGKKFAHTVVQQFFQDVLANYHASEWKVKIAPERDSTYVSVDLQTLFLPEKSFSLTKIRELLAEEIETHIYRSLSGLRSPLALLSSGLAGYSATEEGLANHYIQRVSLCMDGEEKSKAWIGTLATGLASGILTPALSFYELANFLEKMFLIRKLLSSKSNMLEELVVSARQQAWSRAARTFRGVPNLNQPGCCSLKDNIYLRGYLDVNSYLEHGNEESLYIGKVGIEHLDILAELNIIAPYNSLLHFSLAPDLQDQLIKYKN